MHTHPRRSVLIIEQNALLGQCLAQALSGQGFFVRWTPFSDVDASPLWTHHDAIVVGDPGRGSRLEAFIRQLRHAGACAPAFALIGQTTVDRRIALLDAGIDGYVSHPVDVRELAMRLRASLRAIDRKRHGRPMHWEDLTVDLDRMQASRSGRPLALTPVGLRILGALMRAAPRVVRRHDLVLEVWHGYDAPQDGALRSHLCQLRNAVDRGFQMPLIETVRQAGYRLTPLTADNRSDTAWHPSAARTFVRSLQHASGP